MGDESARPMPMNRLSPEAPVPRPGNAHPQGSSMPPATRENPARKTRLTRVLWTVTTRILFPLAIVAGGVLGAARMIETKPEPQKQDRPRQATLVEVERADTEAARVVVEAMGLVSAAREVDLAPQVTGRVQWISPSLVPGAVVAPDEPLVRIDRADYEIALRQRESDLLVAESNNASAEADLLGARAAHANAVAEFERQQELFTSGDVSKSALDAAQTAMDRAQATLRAATALVGSATARVETARAQVERARLDLERTEIRAPFRAVIETKRVDIGDTVSPGMPLTRVVGTDAAWLELAVAERDLRWIRFPARDGAAGSTVELANDSAWTDGATRAGRVIRRLPGVDPAARMARVLVEIPDPFGLSTSVPEDRALLLGTYVRARVLGETLTGAVSIPRDWLRPGEVIWVMTESGTLDIREVTIAYRGAKSVVVAEGLEPGELVVTSALAVPVQDMPLRTGAEPGLAAISAPGATP